ncbi:hypothetical protein [South American cichlid iridovirus]|nr:hypothetical protein [South American cichlid iridovirus]
MVARIDQTVPLVVTLRNWRQTNGTFHFLKNRTMDYIAELPVAANKPTDIEQRVFKFLDNMAKVAPTECTSVAQLVVVPCIAFMLSELVPHDRRSLRVAVFVGTVVGGVALIKLYYKT